MHKKPISNPLWEKTRKALMKGVSSLPPHRVWTSLLLLILVALRTPASAPPVRAHSPSAQSAPFDFGNQTVRVDQEVLPLTNGVFRSSDGRHVASLTDRRVNRSLTRAAAILIDNPTGSGIFFYLLSAARTDGRESDAASVFLGDRITIEAVGINEETVTVHYLDHAAQVPLGSPPTQPMVVTSTILPNGHLQMAAGPTSPPFLARKTGSFCGGLSTNWSDLDIQRRLIPHKRGYHMPF